MTKFTIGCDPEVFLTNEKGELIIPPIENNKYNPLPLHKIDGYEKIDKGFELLKDNVSLEFNIPPCENVEQFENRLTLVLKSIGDIFNLDISLSSDIKLAEHQLFLPDANTFACDPSFNVYSKEEVRIDLGETDVRFAGGHIHIGWEDPTDEQKINIVKWLDLMLLVPSLSMDKRGVERRKYYGMPGSCRLKEYGVEYRALTNFWIFSPGLIRWVYEKVAMAFEKRNEVMSKNLEEQIHLCFKDGKIVKSLEKEVLAAGL